MTSNNDSTSLIHMDSPFKKSKTPNYSSNDLNDFMGSEYNDESNYNQISSSNNLFIHTIQQAIWLINNVKQLHKKLITIIDNSSITKEAKNIHNQIFKELQSLSCQQKSVINLIESQIIQTNNQYPFSQQKHFDLKQNKPTNQVIQMQLKIKQLNEQIIWKNAKIKLLEKALQDIKEKRVEQSGDNSYKSQNSINMQGNKNDFGSEHKSFTPIRIKQNDFGEKSEMSGVSLLYSPEKKIETKEEKQQKILQNNNLIRKLTNRFRSVTKIAVETIQHLIKLIFQVNQPVKQIKNLQKLVQVRNQIKEFVKWFNQDAHTLKHSPITKIQQFYKKSKQNVQQFYQKINDFIIQNYKY